MRVRPEKGSFLAIAVLHLGVGTIHQYSHTVADIRYTPFQLLFIILVVTVAPWVAVYLAWTRKMWLGASLFSISMGAACLFGVLFHFAIESPDLHVNVPAEYRRVFFHSAWALAIVEFVGFVVGALVGVRASASPLRA